MIGHERHKLQNGPLTVEVKADGAELCSVKQPWRGFADPEAFEGEFAKKPGLMLIPPGERRDLGWQLDVLAV